MTTLHDPLYYVAGDTWIIDGLLKRADGTAMNLTGATVTWLLTSVDGSVNHLNYDTSTDGGVVILDAVTGSIRITVDPLDSTTIGPAVYKDWCRVELPSGDTFTEWNGFIRVAPEPASI